MYFFCFQKETEPCLLDMFFRKVTMITRVFSISDIIASLSFVVTLHLSMQLVILSLVSKNQSKSKRLVSTTNLVSIQTEVIIKDERPVFYNIQKLQVHSFSCYRFHNTLFTCAASYLHNVPSTRDSFFCRRTSQQNAHNCGVNSKCLSRKQQE